MTFSNLHFWRNEAGTTLVESLVAMTLLAMIMLGWFQFFVGGKGRIDTDTVRRLAVVQAEKRLESANRFEYASLADSLNETLAAVDLGGINGWRTTTVTSGDCLKPGSSAIIFKSGQDLVCQNGAGQSQHLISNCVNTLDFSRDATADSQKCINFRIALSAADCCIAIETSVYFRS